jgi:D-tyrosyl-tRNA(Tyr) deacylase
MRAVVQRVRNAVVSVGGKEVGACGFGLLVYLGIAKDDSVRDADYLVEKISGLRVFDDEAGKMNCSVLDAGGGLLIISQFTLLGDARHGKRPSYGGAETPERAIPLYEYFTRKIKEKNISCETGVFGGDMRVSYTNEGPVTILLDSKRIF